jgi:hypothetical protein
MMGIMKLWGIITSAFDATPRCADCGLKLKHQIAGIRCVNDWCPQLPFQIFTNRRTGTKPMG